MYGAPVVTIFVRHSPGCKYAGDEFAKRCTCRKHFRWSLAGKQHRRKTGTRSWAEAEDIKRKLEDSLSGRAPTQPTEDILLSAVIQTFEANKKAQGIKLRVLNMYKRELRRLKDFSEARNLFTAKRALTIENLIALRVTWEPVYKSSYSRSTVQKHLNHFLKFCYNAGYIERVPKLSPIKIDAPKTQPLTEAEYERILTAAEGRTRVLIKLMRWSGLAVRDASTLKRSDLYCADGVHKIIRDRTKTGTPLYIPIPAEVAAEILDVMNGNPVYVFWDRKTETSSEYSHAGYMGKNVAAAFKAAKVKSAGHMISHRLRATFAVDLLTKGVPLEHVSKLLGHKSVTTTEKHYAEWVKGRQDRLDNIVSESWGR
jgi:integrase/recombinase XerD